MKDGNAHFRPAARLLGSLRWKKPRPPERRVVRERSVEKKERRGAPVRVDRLRLPNIFILIEFWRITWVVVRFFEIVILNPSSSTPGSFYAKTYGAIRHNLTSFVLGATRHYTLSHATDSFSWCRSHGCVEMRWRRAKWTRSCPVSTPIMLTVESTSPTNISSPSWQLLSYPRARHQTPRNGKSSRSQQVQSVFRRTSFL